jgi:hypothetical protein
MIDASNNFQFASKQISDQNDIFERVKNWLKRFGDRVGQSIKPEEYGHVIILIGQRKTGKSETVKTLCRQISGDKYIIKFDENLLPTQIPIDDKKDYVKIPGCKVIESIDQLNETSAGLLIIEDFPDLTDEGKRAIYNKIKDSRHEGYQANYIIVAHDYKVLKDTVFDQANAILIYRDAAIQPTQLKPRVGLSNGHTIDRAKSDLKQFHYIFVSFDTKQWCNPFLDSRDVNILKKAIRGQQRNLELKEIEYPRKAMLLRKPKRMTKTEFIEALLMIGLTSEEIATGLDTSPEYIWKVKVYLKKRYIAENGPENLPPYLRDSRRKS